jgi:DNA-binding LacI/PurR family transcriptional regulator
VKKTILDVARELNLSPSTISKIVNNTGRISSKTRERVLKYVKESGYVAMDSARKLSAKKSYSIGVIYADISLIGFEHPFFSRILQSFRDYVEPNGYDIVLIVSKLGQNELTYLEWCRNKKVDGVLIVMGNINNQNIKDVVASSYPTVSTDITMPNLTSVFSDDNMGVDLAVDFAIKNNLNKIKVVSGPLTVRSFSTRIDRFKELIKKRNLESSSDDIMIISGFGYEDGYQAGLSIAKNKNDLPEIILVFSDVLAFGVIRSLQDQGIRVPEDISVIGYDDIDFARHFTPSLSTIRQDVDKIGEIAAIELLQSIENPKAKETRVIQIPVSLIERDSTIKK